MQKGGWRDSLGVSQVSRGGEEWVVPQQGQELPLGTSMKWVGRF